MLTTSRYFRLIDPLSPPAPDTEFGPLASVITEAATWFFYDPVFDASSGDKRLRETPSIVALNEAVDAAQKMLGKRRTGPAKGQARLKIVGTNDGTRLVDVFCDRYIAKEPEYQVTLGTGRPIGQRQVLCAFALLYAEQTADALRQGGTAEVCSLMMNVVDLMCEIRRCLDREAGSDLASRRARKRYEKLYRVRAKAIELYIAGGWTVARKGLRSIYADVIRFAESLDVKLSEDRAEQTIYEWLLAHKKTTAA